MITDNKKRFNLTPFSETNIGILKLKHRFILNILKESPFKYPDIPLASFYEMVLLHRVNSTEEISHEIITSGVMENETDGYDDAFCKNLNIFIEALYMSMEDVTFDAKVPGLYVIEAKPISSHEVGIGFGQYV